MRVTWLEYLLMLAVGPLSDEERRIIAYARRTYSRFAAGEDQETLAEAKQILGKYFKFGQRMEEATPKTIWTQPESDMLLEIF